MYLRTLRALAHRRICFARYHNYSSHKVLLKVVLPRYRGFSTKSSCPEGHGVRDTVVYDQQNTLKAHSRDSSEPIRVHHDYHDIDINSLEATLAAHRERSRGAQRRIRYVMQKASPPRVEERGQQTTDQSHPHPGSVSALRQRPYFETVSDGRPIFSSFEDFRAKHKASDEDLERVLGMHASSGNPDREDAGSILDGTVMSRKRKKRKERPQRDYTKGQPSPILPIYGKRKMQLLPSFDDMHLTEHIKDSSNEFVSEAISRFSDLCALSNIQLIAVDDIVDRISDVVKATLPDTSVQRCGSQATGLQSPFSGIDLRVSFENSIPPLVNLPNQARESMKALQAEFSKNPVYRSISIASSFPKLSMHDRASGLPINIEMGPPPNATLQTVFSFLDEYPTIRPLFLFIRQCLTLRGLARKSDGGIASYPLLVMILTAFRHSSSSAYHTTLAEQLLMVLDFWNNASIYNVGFTADPPGTFSKFGCTFDEPLSENIDSKEPTEASQDKAGVSSEPPVSLDSTSVSFLQSRNNFIRRSAKHKRNAQRHPWQLSLQDPAYLNNDLGAAAYRIADILATFRVISETVRKQMLEWDAAEQEERKQGKIHPLRGLIDAGEPSMSTQSARLGRSAEMYERHYKEILVTKRMLQRGTEWAFVVSKTGPRSDDEGSSAEAEDRASAGETSESSGFAGSLRVNRDFGWIKLGKSRSV